MFISRKKFIEMRDATEALMNSIKKLQDRAYLVSIERDGRLNKFTFMRNGELHQIETMGLMSDNLPEWKEKLLR